MPVTQVLMVDDFLPWLRLVRVMLESKKDLNIIAEAVDGLEAVQKAQQLQPDLILLDIGLPTLNGIETAHRILFLGAVPDEPTAILYSLNALTAFGQTDIHLEGKWQLMGAMESLNGWILFGLSTAYLFVLIQMIWGDSRRTRLSENPE